MLSNNKLYSPKQIFTSALTEVGLFIFLNSLILMLCLAVYNVYTSVDDYSVSSYIAITASPILTIMLILLQISVFKYIRKRGFRHNVFLWRVRRQISQF